MKRFLCTLMLAASAALSLQIASAPAFSVAIAAATPLPISSVNRPPGMDASAFPWWVINKEGRPVLLESDFLGPFPSTKWGTLVDSGGSVTADTACNETGVVSTAPCLFYGGKGSVKLLPPNASGKGAEIKTTILSVIQPGDLVAFEAKLGQHFGQATTKMQVGLEYRKKNATDGIHQARFQATCGGSTQCTWQIETTTDGYVGFETLAGAPPAAYMENPAINATAGTPIGWVRIVVDPWNDTYYSFTIPYVDIVSGVTYAYTYDLRSLALTKNGAASRGLILPFVYCINMSTSATEALFTTDWVVSVLPAGWPEGRFPASRYSGGVVKERASQQLADLVNPKPFSRFTRLKPSSTVPELVACNLPDLALFGSERRRPRPELAA